MLDVVFAHYEVAAKPPPAAFWEAPFWQELRLARPDADGSSSGAAANGGGGEPAAVMNAAGWMRFCGHFELSPGLLSKADAARIFSAAAFAGAPPGVLTFPQWLDAIGAAGLAAFAEALEAEEDDDGDRACADAVATHLGLHDARVVQRRLDLTGRRIPGVTAACASDRAAALAPPPPALLPPQTPTPPSDDGAFEAPLPEVTPEAAPAAAPDLARMSSTGYGEGAVEKLVAAVAKAAAEEALRRGGDDLRAAAWDGPLSPMAEARAAEAATEEAAAEAAATTEAGRRREAAEARRAAEEEARQAAEEEAEAAAAAAAAAEAAAERSRQQREAAEAAAVAERWRQARLSELGEARARAAAALAERQAARQALEARLAAVRDEAEAEDERLAMVTAQLQLLLAGGADDAQARQAELRPQVEAAVAANKRELAAAMRGVQILPADDGAADPKLVAMGQVHMLGDVLAAMFERLHERDDELWAQRGE